MCLLTYLFLRVYFVRSCVVSDIQCGEEREITCEMMSLFGSSLRFLFLYPFLHERNYITVSELKTLSYMEITKWTHKSPEHLQLKKPTMPLQHPAFFSAVTDGTHFCLDQKKCHVKKYFHVTFIYAIWKQARVNQTRGLIPKKHYSQQFTTPNLANLKHYISFCQTAVSMKRLIRDKFPPFNEHV